MKQEVNHVSNNITRAGAKDRTGKSLNRVVLEMINKSAEPAKAAPADSLRNLAGGWTEKEASEFNEAIKICEQIDEAMWK